MSIASPRTGMIALGFAAALGGTLLAIGNPFLMVIASPLVASPLAVAIVAFAAWLLGTGRRSYLYGTGKQACWGYLGHTIRGQEDETGQIWVSLTDCHHASGLDLLKRLDRIASADKQKNSVKGWLVTPSGMTRLLDNLGGDPFPIHKLRLFLEREVWRTRRG